jgi:hypothetical protein
MPWRSSRRLVTLRTVTESSTTITSNGASPGQRVGRRCPRQAAPGALLARNGRAGRESAPPGHRPASSPRQPGTAANCGPRLLTTISRLGDRRRPGPRTLSWHAPAAPAPARSGRAAGWRSPQQLAEVAQFAALAGVHSAAGRGGSGLELIGGTRTMPSMVFSGIAYCSSPVHHQRAVDRHGERQANAKCTPLPGRVDAHRAAELLDLFMDHVHAQPRPEIWVIFSAVENPGAG